MHLPTYVMDTSTKVTPQIRLLNTGIPKSGKTESAITFPGPLVLDYDNGLTSPRLRDKKIANLPMYDPAFIKKNWGGLVTNTKRGVADATLQFLRTEGMKMSADQTLIFDTLSTFADALEADLWAITPLGKDKQPDGFWFWDAWGTWWCDFCTLLTQLPCHVVVNAHEAEVRDAETGRVLSYKWMLAGQKFSPRLSQFFTDVFRQTVITEDLPGPEKRVKETYMWQVKKDQLFPYCCTRIDTDKKFLPATYGSFGIK